MPLKGACSEFDQHAMEVWSNSQDVSQIVTNWSNDIKAIKMLDTIDYAMIVVLVDKLETFIDKYL